MVTISHNWTSPDPGKAIMRHFMHHSSKKMPSVPAGIPQQLTYRTPNYRPTIYYKIIPSK